MHFLQSGLSREPCTLEKGHAASSLHPATPASLPWKLEGLVCAAPLSVKGGRLSVSSQHAPCTVEASPAVGSGQRPGFGFWIHWFKPQLNHLFNCVMSARTRVLSVPHLLRLEWDCAAACPPSLCQLPAHLHAGWCGPHGKHISTNQAQVNTSHHYSHTAVSKIHHFPLFWEKCVLSRT